MGERGEDELVDLRAFYEHEAGRRARTSLRGMRVERRAEFIDLLNHEGRTSVLDAGAGPGLDGVGFGAAGLYVVGIDLAIGNGRLAAESGVTVLQGSILDLPIRSGAFGAGWSFSTLMHLAADDAGRAIEEILSALAPGAPLAIGLWGSEAEDITSDEAEPGGPARRFHHRSFDHNRAIAGARAEVEAAERLTIAGHSDYHLFRLRAER